VSIIKPTQRHKQNKNSTNTQKQNTKQTKQKLYFRKNNTKEVLGQKPYTLKKTRLS
jgi:hypothetical protein